MSTPTRTLRGIAAVLLICTATFAADWPEWRGPHRDGSLNAEPKVWPEKLKLQWKVDVGLGHSSPVLAAGRVFIFARQDESETVLAIDPATGATRWKQQYPAPYTMTRAAVPHGPGPKSTPLYSNGRLYTFGISGILSAWDAASGKLVWRKEFAQYKTTSPTFGTAASPIVNGGLLIVHVGGVTAGGLTAFDPATGAVKWSWEGDSPAYSTPIVVDLAGVRQVVTQSRANIVSVAEATGKLLWQIPFTTAYEQNSVTPALYKDTLILSGLDKGVFAVRIARTGDTLVPQTVWENKEVAMYMNSPVISGDLLFGFSHRNKGQLFCLEAATGKMLWLGPARTGENSAMLLGGSGLVSLTNEGQLQVVKVNGKSLEEIRRYTVAESPTWAHPLVLSDGVLIKDLKSLARWSVN